MIDSKRSEAKFQFERRAVGLFQEASGLLAGFELLRPEIDPPDVVAVCGEDRVGLEVRKVFSDERRKGGSRARKQSGVYDTVLDWAQATHRANADGWVVVRVCFAGSREMGVARQRQLAQDLAGLVCNAHILENETREFGLGGLCTQDWPDEVAYMTATRIPGEGEPEWSQHSAAWVGETDNDLIQYVLREKESRYAAFPPELQRRWLLLVLDGSVSTSLLRIHDGIHRTTYASSFDRAFVIDYTGQAFCELKLHQGV